MRSWVELEPGLLLFNMRDNRYCGNVGRQHKSNGVFYVADLKGGSWCQRCYDSGAGCLMPSHQHNVL